MMKVYLWPIGLIVILGLACKSEPNTQLEEVASREASKIDTNSVFLGNDEALERLNDFFNEILIDSINSYQTQFKSVRTLSDFVNTYKRGNSIREQLVKSLEEKIADTGKEIPDLFWLKNAFPGFVPELIAEGTAYYLFADYKQWNEVAKETTSKIDDEFVALCFFAYKADSVEYFFPSWKIQTWDYGGSSLLGRGSHEEMLGRLNRLFEKNKLFAEEILAFKKDLLNDISNANTTFWEPQDKIVAELDTILKTSFIILDIQDKIALETKRKQFDDPERHNIKVNTKSGI